MSKNKFISFRQYLNEAETGVANERPSQESFTLKNVNTAGSNLFKTGSSQIDTNSAEFKIAVKALSPLGPGEDVEIQGGASAVGSPAFDNKALAKQRAVNFANALKAAGVKANFVIIAPKVGVNTELNSPGALAEQFVKYAYGRESYVYKQQTAIDNTAVKTPDYHKKYDQSRDRYILVKVTFDSGLFTANEIIEAIRALKSTKGTYAKKVENVTSSYSKKISG